MAITISGINNNDRIVATDGTIDALSGFNVVGVMTAASFSGDLVGNVTGNVTGNINNTTLLLQTSGTERIRITGNNEIGIAGANYGSAGQVLTSGGSGSAVSWTTINQGVTSDGSYNTVGGTNAGDSIVSGGTHNTVFGHNAGTAISTGDNNTFIGSRAGFNASTGLQNTGVGYNVMGNHGGTGGTALGQNAGNGMGASNYSIALGHSAYSNISANGNNNIVIGYNANVSSSSASNEVTIGNSDITHFRIPGIGVSFSEGGAVISGIVTATSYRGDGFTVNSSSFESATGFGNLVVGSGSGSEGIIIYSGNGVGQEGVLGFADGTSGAAAWGAGIRFRHDANLFRFMIGGSEKMALDTSGNLNVTGILTATTFKGDGSALTNLPGLVSDAQRNTVGGTNAGDSFSGTDATDNTILGYDAGTSLTTGDKNVIIGAFAAKSLTTVGNVVAIGHSAYSSQVSSNCCSVVIGHNALQTYTGSFGQVAIGKGAGQDAGSQGGNNTLIGENAGYGCKGFQCTIVGYHAGSASNTQSGQTIIGHQAHYNGNQKAGNTAVGKEAMFGVSGGNGSQTTAIGYEALKILNNGGNQNTGLGYQAGDKVNTGTTNVIIGYSAASTGTNDLTDGSNNIIIGSNTAASSATVSNEVTIGDSNISHLRIPGIGCSISEGGAVITGIVTATSFSGSGASLTNVDADTVDGLQATSFLRRDANDTAAGTITFSSTGVTYGPIITSNNPAGPKLSINATATGGKHWMFISNGSSNTDGAGYMQLWNSSDSFSPVTFGYDSDIETNFRTGIEIDGNLKLGTANISSPYTSFKRISINNNLILNAANSAGGFAGMQHNAYLNASGNWVRVNNDHATSIGSDDGNFYIRNVGAGTGNISWNMPVKIQSSNRINIGEGNSGSALGAVHINTSSVMGTDTALWIGDNGNKRYMAINQVSNTEMFSHMKLQYNDNSSPSLLILSNPYAPAGYGTQIQFQGYNDGTQAYIETKSEGASNANSSLYIYTSGNKGLRIRHSGTVQAQEALVSRNGIVQINQVTSTTRYSGSIASVDLVTGSTFIPKTNSPRFLIMIFCPMNTSDDSDAYGSNTNPYHYGRIEYRKNGGSWLECDNQGSTSNQGGNAAHIELSPNRTGDSTTDYWSGNRYRLEHKTATILVTNVGDCGDGGNVQFKLRGYTQHQGNFVQIGQPHGHGTDDNYPVQPWGFTVFELAPDSNSYTPY